MYGTITTKIRGLGSLFTPHPILDLSSATSVSE